MKYGSQAASPLKKHVLALAVASAACGGMAQMAWAEEEASGGIDEIVVTASRREQSLQDVPSAVVAVDPADFTTQGLQDLQDVIAYTPGLQFNTLGRPGSGSISARGVPQASSTAVFGIYVDDTPVTSNSGYTLGQAFFLDGLLLDLERVEIIKGPQGTLFGATAVGGMVRYISKKPSLDEVRGSIGVDYNSISSGDNGHTINGRISFPIIEDTLGVTLAAFTRTDAGYVDRQDPSTFALEKNANETDVDAYSIDILFQPTDELDIRIKHLNQEIDSNGASEVLLVDATTTDGLLGDFTNVISPDARLVEYEVSSATINYDFGFATLSSTTSFTDYETSATTDFTGTFLGTVNGSFESLDTLGLFPNNYAATAVDLVNSNGSEKFVQEIRLTSAESNSFEWQAGLYYTDEETALNQEIILTPTAPLDFFFIDIPGTYEELAVFANGTYYFTEDFDLTLGVRVSENEMLLDVEQAGLLGTPLAFALTNTSLTGTSVEEETVDTYLLAARYRVDEDLSVYARIASGYRPATPNPVIFDFAGQPISLGTAKADSAWSYELGAKGSAADGLLSYEAALFYVDWQDFQSGFDAGGVGVIANADSLTSYGFEGTVTLLPTDNFSVTANLTYTNSSLSGIVDENNDGLDDSLGGRDGEKTPNQPEWVGSLQWAYTFDVTDEWSGTLNGGFRYTGDYMSSYRNTPGIVATDVDSRLITDLNVGVNNGDVHIGLYATNLFNDRDVIARTDRGVVPTATFSTANFEQPRTIGVNVRYDF